jgi:hypothetical protein
MIWLVELEIKILIYFINLESKVSIKIQSTHKNFANLSIFSHV